MTNDIGDIVISRLITLPWIDKYAGTVKTLSYQVVDKDGKTTVKRFPASCRTAMTNCNDSQYLDLLPDSTKKSVLFLKDNGTSFVKKDGGKYWFKTSFDLVLWLNLPALGYNDCSYSGIATAGILTKFPDSPFQLSGSIYQRVIINVAGQAPQNNNPFSIYTIDEYHVQYLMYPYEVITLPIEVDFMINKTCLDVEPINDPNNCIVLRPQNMPTDTAETYTVTGLTQAVLHAPVFIYGIFMNGQRLTNTVDYTISGSTITFTNALNNDSITAVYSY